MNALKNELLERNWEILYKETIDKVYEIFLGI